VTIGKKFFFFTAILLIVVLATTLMVLERQQMRQWEDHLHARSRSFARLVTPELLKFFRGSFSPPRRLEDGKLREILAFNPDLVHFSLYSAGGRLLYNSPPLSDEDFLLEPLTDAEVSRRVVGKMEMTLETLTLPQKGEFVDLIYPALGPTGEHVLSVRFLISYDGIVALQQATRSHFVRIALVSIFTSLLLAALAARWISRPLRRLIHGAHAIAHGDLSFRLTLSNRDELGTLAGAFNDMAASLSEKQHELVAKNSALEQAN
jgi:HAMP domain-containing protein